jgi:hypothetical protein
VWQWIDAHRPTRLARQQQAADRGEFVTLTPRLWGGGTLFGELGTVSFATVAEALDAPLGPPVTPPDDLDDHDAVEEALDALEAQRETLTRHHGRRLARQLVNLCEHALAGHTGSSDTGAAGSSSDGGTGTNASPASRPRPLLLATIGLDALLDQDATPGWLLHTLTGGRMKIATHTLQQLVNQRGADVRSIVLDDTGQIVGVGRRTHIPPDWLREATWARDTAVRDPDGTTPVRRADLDHIDPWPPDPPTWPTCSPPAAAGTTTRPPSTGRSPAAGTAPRSGPTAGTAGPSGSHPHGAICNDPQTPDHPDCRSMTSGAARPDAPARAQPPHPHPVRRSRRASGRSWGVPRSPTPAERSPARGEHQAEGEAACPTTGRGVNAARPASGARGDAGHGRVTRWQSDEDRLGSFRELHEVGRADDAFDALVEVVLGQLHHVRRHPAGPQVAAGLVDQVEELGHLGDVEVGDLLAHHLR